MMKVQPAVLVFDNRAEHYQNRFMNVEMYAESLNLFCDSITTIGADILELACGPGNITRYLSKKRPDLTILGTDLAPNMLKLAQINNPQAQFEIMDCRDLGSIDKKYDGIMCGFGLPYLDKQEAINLLKSAAFLLKPGGVLYLSTMEGNNSKSGPQTSSNTGDTIFINYHEGAYLEEALVANGLKIIAIERITSPDNDVTDLILLAVK